jgi:hypothetical protein
MVGPLQVAEEKGDYQEQMYDAFHAVKIALSVG